MLSRRSSKVFACLVLVMVVLSSMLTGCSTEKKIKIGFVAQMTGPELIYWSGSESCPR